MMFFDIEVNGKTIKARNGETILSALERNAISVPTLCHIRGLQPSGACRMCVVEVEGRQGLIPACSHPVEEWMKIRTHSPRVIKARKTNIELLLSNHPDDCLYCESNGNCELQKFAEDLYVRERRFYGKKNKYKTDPSSAAIFRDPAKCILCGRCIRVCEEVQDITALEFIGRGNEMQVGPAFNKGMNLSSCINCGQCIMVCPTGALSEKKHPAELQEMIHNPAINTVIQCSPTLSVTLAEEFGLRPGKDIEGVMYAVLRKIGFDHVFDTSFAADLYVAELTNELLQRISSGEKLPLFSSCCPAWIKYAEQFRPGLLGNISVCKSPQQMMGSVISNHFTKVKKIQPESIYSVSAMPCIAKKFEAQCEQMTHKGITDVDMVLTTRELARLIRLNGIDVQQVESEMADQPYRTRSASGKMLAVSGGLTEAVVRALHFRITGKDLPLKRIPELRSSKDVKEFSIKIGERTYGFAVINGMGNAPELLNEIESGRSDIHFVEVMACPGGCVGGGGQPAGKNAGSVRNRIKAIYEIDDKETVKTPYKNPSLNSLYETFLVEPGSDESANLLHTTYQKREVLL
ncbi:MAG TPA: [FeFe] hydrogenase, group A [Bacteroidales bacterium]|nr:[FeFe] hydrogenase, group A [Bacteroidales bacterium]